MNRQMKKWQALSCVIGGFAILAILTIVPLRLWREEIPSTSNRIVEGVTQRIADGVYSSQMFVAQYDHLDGISIAVANENEGATFTLRVFDENYKLLREQEHSTDEMKELPGECYVALNLDTVVGKQYYYTLECTQGELFINYEMTETSGFIYNGPCYVGDEALGGCNLITTYHYSQPLRKVKTLISLLVICALAAGMIYGLYAVNQKKGKWNETVTLQWGVKRICNPLIIVLTIGGMIATGPLYLFSLQYFDIAVFTLGVLLAGITAWHMVNRQYEGESTKDFISACKEKLPDLLQAFCFAMGLLACIHYMNGLYNIFHDIAYRELLLWMTLAVLVTFNKKEWINIWNVIGVIAGGAWAIYYYKLHFPECINEQGIVNDLEVQVLKLTCYIAIPIVLIALRTIVAFVKGILWTIRAARDKKPVLPKLSAASWLTLGYVVFTIVMGIGFIQHRNTRGWPIYTVAVFGVYALQMFLWKNRSHLLDNVMNGIILNFLGTTFYCLLHRPFMSFQYTRYPHIFHTVTVTATYLSLIMAVAIIKLFYKYNKEQNWKACIYELTLFGIATNYELFTMSRTGLIAIVVTGLVMWFMLLRGTVPVKMKKMLKTAGLIILSVLWFFPICFTAQRTLPALVRQPDQYAEIEEFAEVIMVGNDIQSDDYITLDRFLEIFANKMLSIPEDTFNLYQYRIGGMPEEMIEENYDEEEDDTEARNTVYGDGYVVLPELYAGPVAKLSGMITRDDENDYTNGRSDIFKAYYAELNQEGHETMSVELPNGERLYHAHNIYLQFAFDHGMIMGSLFIAWLLYTLILSVVYFYKNSKENEKSALPMAILLMLLVGGIVEWIAHPCNPVGFSVLLILPALMMQMQKKDENE